MTVKLYINNKEINAEDNQTVLEAAIENGITIPTLCHHKDLTPVGSCRLCLVEVEGWQGQVASCTLPVSEGLVVQTETPSVIQSRKSILELLLQNYVDSGYSSSIQSNQYDQQSEFMYWVNQYGVQAPEMPLIDHGHPVGKDPNPFIWVDFNKCILCTRCVRACAELQGRFVWGVAERGIESKISAGADTTMLDARCESCGACVAYCPTGALTNKMSMDEVTPGNVVTTTCTYCGVGCQLDLNVSNNKITEVTSNPDAPVNGMQLCVKGRYGFDFVHHPDRLEKPRVRKYLLEETQRNNGRGDWIEVDWDTALNITAKNLQKTRDTHGSDSIGLLTSAKCLNEENYLMNKFARQVIGTNSIDHCARL